MNRIKNLLGVFAFALLILSLPTLASAQWGNRDRNDRNNRNNRNDDYYGRNGGYYDANQLKNSIRRLKNDSKDFARFVDRDLDRSRYNGSNREDNINQLAQDFKNATSRLESRFGNGRNLNDSYSEAQDVLRLANQIDRVMRRARLSSNVENYWRNIDNQLNDIERAYNRNGRGNNRNNGGGWRNIFNF